LHEYGRLEILDLPDRGVARSDETPLLEERMDETETIGLEALRLRNSEEYRAGKENRQNEGRSWGTGSRDVGGPNPLVCEVEPSPEKRGEERARGEEVLSGRLTGKVAVGLIIVSGPTLALTFSEAEKRKIAAEVQEGLSFLGSMSPARDVTFTHHVRSAATTASPTTAGSNYEAFEAPWRDSVLTGLGLAKGRAGVRSYASQLRNALHTDWAYVAFFTKYPLFHYAYAIRDHAKVVLSYSNGGRGPNEIDWTFAHEPGHIFGAPDEYSSQNAPCKCSGEHGPFHLPNRNCDNCAPQGGSRCIMRESTFKMCSVTPYHLGYNGLAPLGAGV
jgi:hypothetical protein